MTTIQRARFTSTAWTTFPEPLRALRRASVWTAGMDDGGLVDDLARELADRLTWGIYGETVIPATSLPLDVPEGAEPLIEVGALVVVLDANQPAPEFEDGSPEPAGGEVRLTLEQPISHDLADRGLLIRRRIDVREAFSGLHGSIGR